MAALGKSTTKPNCLPWSIYWNPEETELLFGPTAKCRLVYVKRILQLLVKKVPKLGNALVEYIFFLNIALLTGSLCLES